jgi:hypothetical protein
MAWTFGSIQHWSNEVSVACEYQGAQLREHVARLPVVVSTHQQVNRVCLWQLARDDNGECGRRGTATRAIGQE